MNPNLLFVKGASTEPSCFTDQATARPKRKRLACAPESGFGLRVQVARGFRVSGLGFRRAQKTTAPPLNEMNPNKLKPHFFSIRRNRRTLKLWWGSSSGLTAYSILGWFRVPVSDMGVRIVLGFRSSSPTFGTQTGGANFWHIQAYLFPGLLQMLQWLYSCTQTCPESAV